MKNQVAKWILGVAILMTLIAAVTQTASARVALPDAGSTSVLAAIACTGLVAIRRWKR